MERRQTTAKLIASTILLFMFWAANAYSSAGVKVFIDGCVEQSKIIHYQSKVSLFQVLQNARLTKCNYMIGASWSKDSLKTVQLQQKNELLSLIKQMIAATEEESLIDDLSRVRQLVLSQEVFGRVVNVDLEPYHVEILPLKNRIITEDSRFYFPAQPNFINLVGLSVQQHQYDSDHSITDIYNRYEICESCQHGWLWLVQPNGEVVKRKAGLWTNEKFYLAPGGWLISPIDENKFDDFALGFNQKLANWLATQVVR